MSRFLIARAWLRTVLLTMVLAAFVGCGEDAHAPKPPAPPKARDRDVVVIGINPDYAPLEMVNATSGEMEGFSIDLMKAIAEKGGFKAELKNVDWKGIFGALEVGDIDAIISSVTITEERRLKYDFSEPYYQVSQRLIIRKSDAGKVKSITDLQGNKVGVQIGTTGAMLMEKLFPTIERVNYDTPTPAIADLADGKIGAFMVDEPVAVQYTRHDPQAREKYALIEFRFSEENYGIVVRKGDDALLKKINAGLKAVRDEGIDQELRKKWML